MRKKKGVAYDQLLAEGNEVGNAKVMDIVDALLTQTKAIESAVSSLGLTAIAFEGSELLDSPVAVFK